MLKRRMWFLFLSLALFSGLPQGLWAESGEAANDGNSANALNRLTEISRQLSTLNEKLWSELQDSRRSSKELETMLDTSKTELGGLRRELEALNQELEILQSSSIDLMIVATSSKTELSVLQTALRKAESSLVSLELSFEAYKQAAARRISSLERQNRF